MQSIIHVQARWCTQPHSLYTYLYVVLTRKENVSVPQWTGRQMKPLLDTDECWQIVAVESCSFDTSIPFCSSPRLISFPPRLLLYSLLLLSSSHFSVPLLLSSTPLFSTPQVLSCPLLCFPLPRSPAFIGGLSMYLTSASKLSTYGIPRPSVTSVQPGRGWLLSVCCSHEGRIELCVCVCAHSEVRRRDFSVWMGLSVCVFVCVCVAKERVWAETRQWTHTRT